MKKLIIHRQKQFRSCLVSYWIVYEISREDFIKDFFFTPLPIGNDDCAQYGTNRAGYLKQKYIPCKPKELGIPIKNNETLEVAVDDSTNSVFAISMDGLFSNEIPLEFSDADYELQVSIRGGWSIMQYPFLTLKAINR